MPFYKSRGDQSFVCKSCRALLQTSKQRKFSTNPIRRSTPQSSLTFDDVTIIGGGPVGLSLFTAIKSNPSTAHLKCTLLESQDLTKQRSWVLPPHQYSNRASSLTPTNVSFLESIGAWRNLNLTRVQPYDEMQVWDASNDASVQFNWKAESVRYNAPLRTVATMVENANLVSGLLKRVDESGAWESLCDKVKVEDIRHGRDDEGGLNLSGWPIVTVRDSNKGEMKHIAARLLVGADGLNSPVRTFSGIESRGWDYGRHGIVATLKLQPPPDERKFDSPFESSGDDDTSAVSDDRAENLVPSSRATAYQRFLPSLGGPIAILPLPNNHASMVWSTLPETATYLKSLSPTAFVAVVNAALRLPQVDIRYMLEMAPSSSNEHDDELRWRLQHVDQSPVPNVPLVEDVQQGSIASFPLRLRNASSYTNPRVALVGDAAHTIHPLAGQGLNLGLGDAECLARTIAYATERGMDLGDLAALERYSRERYVKALVMAGGVDSLNSIYQFGGQGWLGSLLGRIRGWGMGAVGVVPGLKEEIMKRAE